MNKESKYGIRNPNPVKNIERKEVRSKKDLDLLNQEDIEYHKM